jgi:hypothetical protein
MRRPLILGLFFWLVSFAANAACPGDPSTCGNPMMTETSGSVMYATAFGVKADGTTSDDVALKAAIDACSTKGTKLILPPGKILLNGNGSSTITIKNCNLEGVGYPGGVGIFGPASNGTMFVLTSTTVQPFILGRNWALNGLNFFWPDQTGAVVYPPLFTDDGVNSTYLGYIHNVAILNAYDAFKATTSGDWSNIDISDSSLYAVHDLFHLFGSGDSWRITNVHFTHGNWAAMVGYPTVQAYLNTANANNTIFHIYSGGYPATVTMAISNTSAFSWRYGLKLEANANFTAGTIQGGWDGVATIMDSSAPNACLSQTQISGSGFAYYTPVFDAGGGVTGKGNAPAFNLGAGNPNCHGPVIKNFSAGGPGVGSFIVSAGQEVELSNVFAVFGGANDGGDYYAVHVTANPNGGVINIRDSTLIPSGSSGTKMHGIVAEVPLNYVNISGFDTRALNEAVKVDSGTNNLIQLRNNNINDTVGPNSIVIVGTGPVLYTGNVVDKPTNATVSNCGTGATVIGTFSGTATPGGPVGQTVCTITLPWRPYGYKPCTAMTAAGPFAIGGGVSGVPPSWTFTSAGSWTGSQLFFDCGG